MSKLPKFQSKDQGFNLLQSAWASIIDPITNNPANKGVIVKNVILSSSCVVNHGLGRTLQGWEIVRLRGSATVYDNQNANTTPDKTLLLIASSGVSADILCF
jgi:hypothetical protein